jgi:hypothetical protein
MPFTFRSLTSTPPPITPKSSKWLRIVPVAVVVGATVFYFTSKGNKEEEGGERYDTEKLYATKSTTNLALSWMILKLCSYDFVVSYGPNLLEWANKYPFLIFITIFFITTPQSSLLQYL